MKPYLAWWRDWGYRAKTKNGYPPILLSEFLDLIGGLNPYLKDKDMDILNTNCAIEQVWAMKEGLT